MFIDFSMNSCSVFGSMESGLDHFQEIITCYNSPLLVQPGPSDREISRISKKTTRSTEGDIQSTNPSEELCLALWCSVRTVLDLENE
jgi:hypothetical protein